MFRCNHHQINHTDVFQLTVLRNVTLARSYSALPDDDNYTETCWTIFYVNFNTSFKAFLWFICW